MYAVTVEDAGEFVFPKEKVKEATEEFTQGLKMKVEHLFVAKGADLSESLKTFVEEHPDIIFDFVVVGFGEAAGEHGGASRGDEGAGIGPDCYCDVG